MSENLCGSCLLCCKVMEVPEIAKLSCKMCDHAEPGAGCQIYSARPESCREFECLWLQTQKDPVAKFPESLRPDHCHVVLTTTEDGEVLLAHVDPSYPDAYQQGGLGSLIESFRMKREAVVVVTGKKRKILTIRERSL